MTKMRIGILGGKYWCSYRIKAQEELKKLVGMQKIENFPDNGLGFLTSMPLDDTGNFYVKNSCRFEVGDPKTAGNEYHDAIFEKN